MKLLLGVIVATTFAMTSCQNAADNTQNKDASANESVAAEPVNYTIANRYFVKNTFSGTSVPNNKLESFEAFEEVFGAAAVMGEGGMPTPIDFNTHFAVPIILTPTETDTHLEVKSVEKNAANELVVNYSVHAHEKISYTMQPSLVVVVEKADYSKVVLNQVQ